MKRHWGTDLIRLATTFVTLVSRPLPFALSMGMELEQMELFVQRKKGGRGEEEKKRLLRILKNLSYEREILPYQR